VLGLQARLHELLPEVLGRGHFFVVAHELILEISGFVHLLLECLELVFGYPELFVRLGHLILDTQDIIVVLNALQKGQLQPHAVQLLAEEFSIVSKSLLV